MSKEKKLQIRNSTVEFLVFTARAARTASTCGWKRKPYGSRKNGMPVEKAAEFVGLSVEALRDCAGKVH